MEPGAGVKGTIGRAAAAALALVGLMASTPAAAAPAAAAPIDVEVEGLSGDLRRNVLATLSIERRRGRVPEGEARDLHGRAQNEIELALQPFGHYRPAVWSRLDLEGGRWRARYEIDPGPPMRVDSLRLEVRGPGREDPRFQEVLASPAIEEGDVLVHAAYEDVKESIQAVAARHGYLDGRFTRHEMRVDVERNAAAVVLVYDSGPRYVFGPVEFRQEALDPELLQGYVTFRRGEPVDLGRLLEMEQALNNSPYWSRVEVRPDRGAARGEELPIVVELDPVKPEKYTLGVGYGTDNGAHGRANAELRRLNRRGHRAGIEGTLSTIEQSLAGRYQIPWPYPRSDLLTFSGGYAATRVTTTEARTSFAGVNLSRVWGGWQQAFQLQYRREQWTVGLDRGRAGFLVPEASTHRTRADDPVFPAHARKVRLRISGAHTALFSADDYLRLEAQAKWIRSFGSRQRLIAHAEAGQTWTAAFRRLPPAARFFAGGAQSVRGYGFQRLGERDAAGNVIGGTALAVAGVEYELYPRRPWGLAVFYEAGNAMTSWATPLRPGAGGGLRWISPIGLVRLDVGWPIADAERGYHVHVSVGPGL